MGNDMWGTGEGRVGGKKDINSMKTHVSFFGGPILQLVRGFFVLKYSKKRWPATEQASNKTVAKKSWRYLFSNPDGYIYTLSDLSDLSDLIGLLSRTIQQY